MIGLIFFICLIGGAFLINPLIGIAVLIMVIGANK